jgi:hypothetical protein
MNWKLELAKSLFGLRHIGSFPDLATEAMGEGVDTPSLRVLAGLSPVQGNNEEITEYLQKTLRELEVDWPSEEEAAWLLLRYYIDAIIDGAIDPHAGLHTIISKIYRRMRWSESDKHYAGDSIKIEKLYGLCDTFDDLAEASTRWDKEKTNDQLKAELQKEIRNEAGNYRENFLKSYEVSESERGKIQPAPRPAEKPAGQA